MQIVMEQRRADEYIDFPMTRERYLSTWKVFRSISDENVVTARHIIGLESWKNVRGFLDIGCGDGLIAKAIAEQTTVEWIGLLDPDQQMLEQALKNVRSVQRAGTVYKYHGRFESQLPLLTGTPDAFLAVHLVYLVSGEDFHLLLNSLPVGKPLIVVLDDENTVFTELWKRTAPKYAERSAYVRKVLSLPDGRFKVRRSTIHSRLPNPLEADGGVKEALLSIMSYADFALMDADTRQYVEESVQRHLYKNELVCSSACFEVMRVA